MSIIAESTPSFKRELIPSGNHVARCYSMIEIGTITENVMGEDKDLHKVRVTFELPSELRVFKEENGEQPMVISKEYTLSMHEKANLRKDLESWRGKGFTEEEALSFDITALLGVSCMINIIHKTSKKGDDYSIISGITPVPNGLDVPEKINEVFELSFEKWSNDAFNGLPDFLKDKIKSSKQFKAMGEPVESVEQELTHEDITEKLPF